MNPQSILIPISLLATSIIASMAMTPEARRSFEAFEQQAEGGDSAAQFRLAGVLERGWDSIAPDSARALSLVRRSAVAGYPPAMNYLGYLYANGFKYGRDEGLTANSDSAIHWLKKAADMGDPKAMSNVAYLLLNKDESREPREEREWREEGRESREQRESRDSLAAEYLRRAAELGQPTAMSMLGDLYRDGRGVEQDTLLAASLYEYAMDAGLADAEPRLIALMADKWQQLSPDSSFALGVKYFEGHAPWAGVMLLKQASVLPEVSDEELANPTDSLKLSISSAVFRAAEAMTMVGDAIGRGYGHRYNHRQSLEWFLKGAMAGNPRAQQIVKETEAFFPDTFHDIREELSTYQTTLRRLAPLLDMIRGDEKRGYE